MNKHEETASRYLKDHPKRLRHSQGVAREAARLARIHGGDEQKAYIAGMVHDIAKGMTDEELLRKAREYGLEPDSYMLQNPALIHGPLAAEILRRDEGMTDGEILRAVALHTTGAPDMGLLDKIVYTADMTEENRNLPGLEEIRALAGRDLDRAVAATIRAVVNFVMWRGLVVHPRSLETYNSIIMHMQSKEEDR